MGNRMRSTSNYSMSHFKRYCTIHSCLRAGLILAVSTACSLSDLVKVDSPPTGTDPDAIKTAAGALDLYRGVIHEFRSSTTGYSLHPTYVVTSGLLSDELASGQYPIPNQPSFSSASSIDSRNMQDDERSPALAPGIKSSWSGLQRTRLSSMTAIAALREYAPNAPKDYVGHAFALWGMAELFLANLYCSGIPLTTIDLNGGYTYQNGSTTQQVYEHAIAMFDSALVYAKDSAQFRNLANVGKGWALLNLNKYTDAAQAVAGVPDNFVYFNFHSAAIARATGTPNFTTVLAPFSDSPFGSAISEGLGTVADTQGVAGLPYRSSQDPRTAVSKKPEWQDGAYQSTEVWSPDRWAQNSPGNAPIVMASGVEARLIEAEASLKAGTPTWLTVLNDLRTNGSFTVEPGTADTTWGSGSGAVIFADGLPGLRPLVDPGNTAARVSLLFQERAYWLFLTGRRHSDMRRLVRQYGRQPNQVFPSGRYPTGPTGVYGRDVVLPAPYLEKQHNSRYTGCINRDA